MSTNVSEKWETESDFLRFLQASTNFLPYIYIIDVKLIATMLNVVNIT